ncbi:hypothetical protein GP482_03195 [Streptococcus ruminicola]|uniref:Tetratricopeptide repeat protein n=1 Tax=Streptococcus ruminicola TaxID=2686210 RepID=A0AAE6R5B8_9STRE|nr:hypothetical protein [Streptococcus ruminicola]QGZ27206.1 hypothetical protein GP482_03195 [Streptococcus ruminicola]
MISSFLEKIEEVQQLQKRARNLYLFFMFLFFISFIYSIESNTILCIILAICFTPVVLTSYAVFNNILLKKIDSVLLTHLNVKPYLEIINAIGPEQVGKKSIFSKSNYYLRITLAYFLLGRVDDSEKALENVSNCLKRKEKFLTSYYYLRSLIAMTRRDKSHFEETYNSLIEISKKDEAVKSVVSIVKAMFDIENLNTNDYFDNLDSHNNLEKIIFNFFKAKNQLLLRDTEGAKKTFQQIANENPELFYVREAKKYLEELAND